ncbi:ribonuclease III [Curvibacter sp. APW13]|uniref:ribonuclease III n=1 Tax=Curvibacter sp. APW13 TaxID=3077236 RepID=UPI0028DD7C70|nr:ribonuclease III [Curvibacter sp. APW13]MDT8990932.1 ribonuclease III [Curvibacter sp. APW13]
MTDALDLLAQRLQHRFADTKLLQTALTHRSFSADHYERLEFLGDAVLDLSISAMLYERLQDQTEGDLSRIRANLVRQETLYQLALDLGLSQCLRLGEGESRSGGNKRPSILADVLEALIGAVYLDGGFDAALALVKRLYQNVDINPQMQAAGKDAKTELQEWLQGRKMKLPVYSVVAVLGAAHQQSFDVECRVDELRCAQRGLGGSRRAAEQAAAAAMLEQIKAKGIT